MRGGVCAVAALAWMVAATAAPAASLVLTTENSPPFNMASGGDIVGISADIVKAAMARTGTEYSLRLYPWQRAYAMALKSPDTCVFSTTLTEARRPQFKWIGPLVSNTQVVFGRADRQFKITSLDDLRHYVVGGYEGDAVTLYLESKGVPVKKATSDRLNVKMLQLGRIDLWATGEAIGRSIAAQEGIAEVAPVFRVQDTVMYLACNLSVPDPLVATLNAAIAGMNADGTIARITKTYR